MEHNVHNAHVTIDPRAYSMTSLVQVISFRHNVQLIVAILHREPEPFLSLNGKCWSLLRAPKLTLWHVREEDELVPSNDIPRQPPASRRTISESEPLRTQLCALINLFSAYIFHCESAPGVHIALPAPFPAAARLTKARTL